MIKLENIHTDAELLGVFKRLSDRLANKIEDEEGISVYSNKGALTHTRIVEIEEQVLEEFIQQENVLELPKEVSLQANDSEAMNKNLYGLKGLPSLV